MGVRDVRDDQTSYSRGTIQALLQGEVFIGYVTYQDGEGNRRRDRDYRYAEDRRWLRLRSRIEETGLVESEDFLTVLDLERAIDALRAIRPDGAAAAVVVSLLRDGFELSEIRRLVKTGKPSAGMLVGRVERFLVSYLSGQEAEAAWEATAPRKPEEAAR